MITGALMALSATPTLAQSQADSDAQVDEVVVTGSRIRVRDTQGNSPIATVTGEALQEIGSSTIETYLNALPQIAPHGTKVNNNPGYAGAAYLNLRDLGTQRGLTLVDGRRLVPGSSGGAVNLSILPSGLIDRVEVITGGASAVYGADAVSGVVNFILKKDFEGLEFSARTGISEEGDAAEQNISLIAGAGTSDGRGHITFSASWNQRDAVYQGERDWTAVSSYYDESGFSLSGSPTTGDGTFSLTSAMVTPASQAAFINYFAGQGLTVTAANLFQNQRIGFNPDGSLFIAGNGAIDGTVIGYKGPNTSGWDNNSGFAYNFNPVNLFLTPFERYNFYTDFNYDISDNIEFYGNALYSTYTGYQALAESPASFNVSVGSAVTLDPTVRSLLSGIGVSSFGLSRRTNELGPRASDVTVSAWQLTGGIRGQLPEFNGRRWNYDVFVSRGKYTDINEALGYPNAQRIAAALAGCPAGSPPGPVGSTGAPTTCVPLNPFGANNITQEQREYITAKGQTNRTHLEQVHSVASVDGELFDLWGAGAIGFAAGLEYRSIDYDSLPSADTQTGSLLGGNAAAPVQGGYNVAEVFGELRVPLLSGVTFADYLGLEAGYRYSDYSLGFTTEAWKYGGEWAPVDWLRFRALAQRAVRAPSVGELYSTRSEGYPSVTSGNIDPCNATSSQRTGANAAAVLALCQAQSPHINATWVGAAAGQQYRVFSGGNPNLEPEIADTLTYGFVLRAPRTLPNWTHGFSATVDYWKVEIENVVSTISGITSLSRCFNPDYNPGFSNSSPFCQAVHRDPSTGMLTSVSTEGYLSQQQANLASWETSGVDLGVNYQTRLSDYGLSEAWGQLGVSVQTTWYEIARQKASAADPWGDSWIGTIGNGSPGQTASPEWKTVTRLSWSFLDDFNLSLRWQYLSSIDTEAPSPDIEQIDAQHYFYLSGRWAVNDTVELFGGIDNLFDNGPVLYSGGFQFNTDPSTYDIIGRYYYVGVRARF